MASHSQPDAVSPKKIKRELKMNKILNDKPAVQTSIPFSFEAPKARKVSLAGDFNDWDPEDMPMYKGSNGVWYLTVSLTPGLHEYRFIADGVWRDDPAAQQKIANVMGSENCVRLVSAEVIAGPAQPQGPRVPRGITL